MEKHIHNCVRASDEVIGVSVKNHADEHLGKVKEVILDKVTGHVAYVVLDSGSFFGMGGKYFAMPWNIFNYDPHECCFRVDIDEERLKNAPGFGKDHWPDMADRQWGTAVYNYYGSKVYWE